MLTADRVEAAMMKGGSARRGEEVAPRFKAGDRVVVRNIHPWGHTRAPRYVRGRTGVIDRDHGVFVFPDSNALFEGEKPQHVYAVRFEAAEIWGAPDEHGGATGPDAIYADLWDDYLDPA